MSAKVPSNSPYSFSPYSSTPSFLTPLFLLSYSFYYNNKTITTMTDIAKLGEFGLISHLTALTPRCL